MSAITELAERLGKAIAECGESVRLREARAELDKDEAARKLLEQYRQQTEKVDRLRQENKPVEVEDKHRLEELRGRLVANETFKEYSSAQVEYIDLMRRVQQAMQKHMGQTEGAENVPGARHAGGAEGAQDTEGT